MAADRRLIPIRFGIWSTLVDRVSTEQAYARCRCSVTRRECAPCRNSVAAGDYAFPAPVLALLADLGIDSRCEAEVYSQGRDGNGLHRSGGWFHFIDELDARSDNVERVVERVVEHFPVLLDTARNRCAAAFASGPNHGLCRHTAENRNERVRCASEECRETTYR
jgi:hypothetical protein